MLRKKSDRLELSECCNAPMVTTLSCANQIQYTCTRCKALCLALNIPKGDNNVNQDV